MSTNDPQQRGGPEHGIGVPISADRLRALVGIALLAAAGLCFCLRLATASHDRAWSAGAVPRASYDLVVGTQYRLSSVAGPIEAPHDALVCTIQDLAGAGGSPAAAQSLTLTELSGDRITHDIASFVAPFTGSARIACAGGLAVFVDGAQGAGRDTNGLLVVAGITLGVIGLLLASAAVGARRPETPAKRGSVPAPPAPGTTVEAAPGV
ncbi:MAG: hypothetical protein JWN61_714 [Pseudonocardiales bacterium]|nr:hypothetical protein [Pseudonocardiales bacterium]